MTTPNQLIKEQSPYLLQHAHNPVEWHAWNKEALNKSRKENKPILLSIGYASCHWCHVMERESFENPQIAAIMNQYFICIKVDREERPDIDAIYMEALQAMGIPGGWPLHMFLMPDQKPFYGGTYFPPSKWQSLLLEISKAYHNHSDQLHRSAEKFYQYLNISITEKYQLQKEQELHENNLIKAFQTLESHFDTKWGGLQKTPKFPMPSIYTFLIHYYSVHQDHKAIDHTLLTLKEMSRGGLYDQVGGGFSRYSVDAQWFLPHFEKMLYDNAQLLSLYAEAYKITQSNDFKIVIEETFHFLQSELKSKEGIYYSAIDADSEGSEGRFYAWTNEELRKIIAQNDWEEFQSYFSLQEEGNWQKKQNLLHVNKEAPKPAPQKIERWKKALLEKRNLRKKPELDHNIICSWNALLLKSFTDSFMATQEKKFLDAALEIADGIEQSFMSEDHKLIHIYKDPQNHHFLEDYAFTIDAFIALYQVTQNFKYLRLSHQLLQTTLHNFYDPTDGLFFYTPKDSTLIARKKELFDDVIPSGNAMMAKNLFLLSKIFTQDSYLRQAQKMIQYISPLLAKDAPYLSYWASVYTLFLKDVHEIVIIGKDALSSARQLLHKHNPFILVLGSEKENNQLELFEDRGTLHNATTFYVCKNKTCQLPTNQIEEVWAQLK